MTPLLLVLYIGAIAIILLHQVMPPCMKQVEGRYLAQSGGLLQEHGWRPNLHSRIMYGKNCIPCANSAACSKLKEC